MKEYLPFNNQQEIWEHLAKGGEIISKSKIYYKFVDGRLKYRNQECSAYKVVSISFYIYDYYFKVPNWEDTLNFKDKSTWKICRVWDDHPDSLHFNLISSYGCFPQYRYIGNDKTWENAEPITPEQLANPSLLFIGDSK